MGKTDKRLHDRTKAADFPDRWAQTFGVVTPSPPPNTNGDYVAIIKPNSYDSATDQYRQTIAYTPPPDPPNPPHESP